MLLAVLLIFQQFISITGIENVINRNNELFQLLGIVLAGLICTGSVINLFFPGWVLHHLLSVKVVNKTSDVSLQQLIVLV